MTVEANVTTFSEICWVSICPIGGSDIQIEPIVDTISIKPGKKGVEGIPNTKGGRVVRYIPQEDAVLSFEGYCVGLGVTTGDDVSPTQFYVDPENAANSDPQSRVISRNRKRMRIAIAFGEEGAWPSGAHGASATDKMAERITFVEGYLTTDDIDFTDKVHKQSFEFVVVPFDKDGNGNIKYEATKIGGSQVIPALGSYTTANKF
ncbi:MAG: hypothetical protein DRP09_19630 [Candidatus Thorarchaeota archaeon]|nr:MAG: hypothetical protein DRP09_19630 [Candidatus Thorarchaeota archaeon]